MSRLKAASSALLRPVTSGGASQSHPLGAWVPEDQLGWNWWQRGGNAVPRDGGVPVAHACINAISGVLSAMPPAHKRLGKTVTTSAVSRWFEAPAPGHTWPEFADLVVRSLLTRGEFIALAARSDRFEVTRVDPLDPRLVQILTIEDDDGAPLIFYDCGTNTATGERVIVPERDVLHIRYATDPRNPLRGLSPLQQAAVATGLASEVYAQQISFHANGMRPSGIVSTDQELSRDQIAQLREGLRNTMHGVNTGGLPILSSGLKFESVSLSADDTHLIELLQQTGADVRSVFSVPEGVIGGATSSQYKVHEGVVAAWLSLGLNPILEKIERRIDRLFGLRSPDAVSMDSTSLFKLDPSSHGEHLTRLVAGGVISPNEARHQLGLLPDPDGDDLFTPAGVASTEQRLLDVTPRPHPAPTKEQAIGYRKRVTALPKPTPGTPRLN